MIKTIYIILLSYFVLGAIFFHLIGRKKKDGKARRQHWIKFLTYFIIIHTLFFSIIWHALAFRTIVFSIIIVGLAELIGACRKSGCTVRGLLLPSLLVYAIFASGFWHYGKLDKGIVLYGFLILSLFDAFSQISGQLLGRTPLFPKVSPNKTVEGLAGGAIVAIGSAGLLTGLTAYSVAQDFLLALGVVVFAFTGDFLTSFYKRRCGIKDFSRLLPGHGGFLDRFDSLVGGGAFLALAAAIIG